MKYKVFNSRKIIIALLAGVVMTATACKKYLSPPPESTFEPSIVFGNIPNARAALMGSYLALSGDFGYGIRASVYYPYDTDEFLGGGAGLDQSRHQIAHYTLQAGNADIVNSFNQFYAGIERANNCIYYIPRMPQYTSGSATDQVELRRMVGEAYILRAQFYYEIIRNWGDVPAQWEPSSLLPTLFIPRTNRDSIYDHILNDLITAKTMVPWRTAVSTVDERFTKGAAMALRAKIALARGGYSLRMSGKMERPSNYLDFYKIARAECDTLMQNRSQHNLLSNYVDIWKGTIDAHKIIDASGEIIMQAAMANGTNSDSKLGLQNGTKINGVGGGLGQILPTFFYQFDSTDVRRDITCVPYEIIQDQYARGHAINSIYDGKFRKDWVTGPSFYFSSGTTSGSGVTPAVTLTSASNASLQNMQLNWPMIRFADVLLMFAETENEISGIPTSAAVNAWREVSLRAHSNNANLLPAVPSDKDGFFKLLVRERLLEFGGEGIRKYDLIRWNLLGTALAETKANLQRMANTTATPMIAPTYMAAPPSYTLGELPQYMWFYTFIPISGDNYTNIPKVWTGSYYKPTAATQPNDPTRAGNPLLNATYQGYNRVAWSRNANITTSFVNYIGYGFVNGRSELFPLPQATLDANPALQNKNNPGY